MREAAERLASSSGDDAAFADAATDASLLFLDLKATNRAALEGIEATRATTGKAKLDLDHKRLELQNVVYEKGHIQKEIRACQDFRSAYDDDTIGLCSVAEFKKLAPAEWKEAGDDPHAVMLKRLSHELAERKKMCEREKELEVRHTREGTPARPDPRSPRAHSKPKISSFPPTRRLTLTSSRPPSTRLKSRRSRTASSPGASSWTASAHNSRA